MVMPFLGSSRHPMLASAKAACEPDVSCGGVVFADSLPSGLQYETRAPPTAAHPRAPFHSDSWVKIGCVGDQQKGSAPVQMTANTPSKTLPLEEQPAPANTETAWMKKANAAAEAYREPLETKVFKSPLPCNERMYVATYTAHQATY
jgi:hypothetical protein